MASFKYFLKSFLNYKAKNIRASVLKKSIFSCVTARSYPKGIENINVINKVNRGIDGCKEDKMSLQQGLKGLFGNFGGKAMGFAATTALTTALMFNAAQADELPSYRDPSKATTAEELHLINEWNADIKADKIHRSVRRHSYEHPQDIGVFLLRGDLDKDKYSDQQIEDALAKKILNHFSSLTWPTPGLHFEAASDANKNGTAVLYYVGGKQIKCDLNNDGINPGSENVFDVGQAISLEVLEVLAEQYEAANQ